MVEKWLRQVEEVMIASVRKVSKDGVAAYAANPRNKWVVEWPGQVVLCVSSIFWTEEVAKAIQEPGGLKVLTFCSHNLNLIYFVFKKDCI